MNKTTTSVYRIFLSSTAIDMVEHRKKVTEAILRMGDLPVAMETFGASTNEPVEVCKNKVRESNALVVMVAHRYGWVPGIDEGGDGFKSITRIEVETALNEGIPVFAFLVDMNYGWNQPKEQDLLLKAKGKAREWTNQSGYMECILRAHILAAEISYCSGDFPKALTEVTTGLNQAEGCGFGKFAIDLLLQLAKLHLAIPDARAALRNARQALDRSEHPDCGYAWGEANALHLCGICHKELKEPELARKRLEAALKIRKRIQHPGAVETETILKEL